MRGTQSELVKIIKDTHPLFVSADWQDFPMPPVRSRRGNWRQRMFRAWEPFQWCVERFGMESFENFAERIGTKDIYEYDENAPYVAFHNVVRFRGENEKEAAMFKLLFNGVSLRSDEDEDA